MMWIMGYKDGVEPLNNIIQDPPIFNGRNELSPLMPRPPAITAFGSSTQSLINPTITAQDHLLALNHYHLAMAEHHRRELSTQQHVVVSSRWNPTPEQLQTLEEIYRRGTRTPSAEQIQQITAQLRRYGKIEGKNVFYWFQNHKARERQKRRRQLESSSDEQQPHNNNLNTGPEENGAEKREPIAAGANRGSYEVELSTKNRPLNSITVADQKTKAAEGKSDHGWAQFDIDDAESLHQRRNATWHSMHLPCNSSSSPTNLLRNSSCSAATTAVATNHPSAVVLRPPPPPADIITSSSEHHVQDSMADNLFFEPYYVHAHENLGQAQTLQLFPLRSHRELESVNEEESVSAMLSTSAASTSFAIPPNYQFFEFLPLKN